MPYTALVRPALQRFLDLQDRRLAGRRLYALAAMFRYPLPVEDAAHDMWFVLKQPRHVHQQLLRMYDRIPTRGASIRHQIYDVRYEDQGRAWAHVAIIVRNRSGRTVYRIEKELFLGVVNGRCRVKMMRILEVWPPRFTEYMAGADHDAPQDAPISPEGSLH